MRQCGMCVPVVGFVELELGFESLEVCSEVLTGIEADTVFSGGGLACIRIPRLWRSAEVTIANHEFLRAISWTMRNCASRKEPLTRYMVD